MVGSGSLRRGGAGGGAAGVGGGSYVAVLVGLGVGAGGVEAALGAHEPGETDAGAPDDETDSVRRALRENTTRTMPAMTLQAIET